MAKLSWTKESDWKGYYKKLSNKELIQSLKDHREQPRMYRGTVLPKVAQKELARRKATGKMRVDAGSQKQSQQQRPTFFSMGGF